MPFWNKVYTTLNSKLVVTNTCLEFVLLYININYYLPQRQTTINLHVLFAPYLDIMWYPQGNFLLHLFFRIVIFNFLNNIIVCLSMVHLKSTTGALSTCVCALWIKLEFDSVGFCREGETREPREKPVGPRREPNTNSTHMWCQLGGAIECGPHWWQASTITTVPPLLRTRTED